MGATFVSLKKSALTGYRKASGQSPVLGSQLVLRKRNENDQAAGASGPDGDVPGQTVKHVLRLDIQRMGPHLRYVQGTHSITGLKRAGGQLSVLGSQMLAPPGRKSSQLDVNRGREGEGSNHGSNRTATEIVHSRFTLGRRMNDLSSGSRGPSERGMKQFAESLRCLDIPPRAPDPNHIRIFCCQPASPVSMIRI